MIFLIFVIKSKQPKDNSMILQEFKSLLDDIRKTKCETQTLEIKKAAGGAPMRLYDTLSSFSNQDEGGVIVLGIDETGLFAEVGVYDAHDLIKKISEQCKEMEPPVRPLLNAFEVDGKTFVTVEIPGIDVSRRPCLYKGKGRLRGAYIRVGDSDELMTEYEVYSYETYREHRRDDLRIVEKAFPALMDQNAIQDFIRLMQRERVNLSRMSDEEVSELTNLTHDNQYTISAVMMFSKYPQAFFPQICITAVRIPGTVTGELGSVGERFLDNRRIEGTIPEMFDAALQFIKANMKTKTVINTATGHREDQMEYPLSAVREAILNALIHRDYSQYTEGMPIQILMFADRMEIRNPGGLYGRMRIDQLGKVQPDTRNPTIVAMMEALRLAENRYSGIPTIRREIRLAGLREAEFSEERGNFVVRFFNTAAATKETSKIIDSLKPNEIRLLQFCQTPRTREEIAGFLNIQTLWYAIKTHVAPLIERGLIALSVPSRPKSSKQTFRSTIDI
jgi:ATP-dependent DNA helicase RecG